MIPGGTEWIQWHEVGQCILEIFIKTVRQAFLRNISILCYILQQNFYQYIRFTKYIVFIFKNITYTLLRTHASFPNISLLRYLECSKNNFIQINHCNSRKPIFYICCLFSDKSNCFGNKFCFRRYFFRYACLFLLYFVNFI